MDTTTRKIADYAAGVRFADITDETIHAATQRLLDSLGCALGAYNCEPAQIGRRLASGQTAGKYPGRVLCFGERIPAEAASFINTTMIRNLDFNDRYPGGHPSDCLGALLALSGATHIDGKRFLTAMIVIYEIFARLSDATRLSRRGWDQGYAIAIATAAGICNLLGLSVEHAADAVGIVATSSLPLRVTRSGELTSWKNVATAYAARNGVFAALLAAEGMSGPGNAFEGRNGLFENVTGAFDLAPVSEKRRRLSNATRADEILAYRDQRTTRGLGGAGTAHKSSAECLARDRSIHVEVHLVRDRQRAREVGSADARDGGSQFALYLCSRARGRADPRKLI